MAEEEITITRPMSALDNMTRLNLLDVVLERTRNFNKKSIIHCLICIGRINTESRLPQELVDHYEGMLKNTSGNFNVENATGLLLVYPHHFIHILEGPENILSEVMDELNYSNIIGESKVLVYINDIPSKLFSQWSSRVLNLASVRMDESKMQESIETKVSEAVTLILKLAKELGKLPKMQLKTTLDQLTTKFPNLLLPQDLIESLLKSTELLSVIEFRKKYVSPIDITLDGELVWPVHINLPLIK